MLLVLVPVYKVGDVALVWYRLYSPESVRRTWQAEATAAMVLPAMAVTVQIARQAARQNSCSHKKSNMFVLLMIDTCQLLSVVNPISCHPICSLTTDCHLIGA